MLVNSTAAPARKSEPGPTPRPVWITLAILIGIAGWLCYLIVRPYGAPLLLGTVLAVLFYPLYQRFESILSRPTLAAALTTVIMLLAVAVPIGFLITLVIRESRQALQALGPDPVNQGAERIWSLIEAPLAKVAPWIGSDVNEIRDYLMQRLNQLGGAAAGRAVGIVGAATGGAINFVIAILTLFFALRNGAQFYARVVANSPLGPQRTERIANSARRMIVASFYGIGAVAVTQGVLCGVGSWIAGLPSPSLWGLAATAASLIPLFGSALVWVPGAVVLALQGSYGWAVFLLLWGGVVVANSDNLIRPLVLMSEMPTNPLLILIAALGGVEAFGLIGILLGPVILSMTLTLLDLLREELDGASGSLDPS